MAQFRPFLYIALIFLGYMLYVEWQKDFGPQPAAQPGAVTQDASQIPAGGDVPNAADAPSAGDVPAQPSTSPGASVSSDVPGEAAPEATRIRVTSDVLYLEIDPVGGTVVVTELLDYPVEQKIPDNKVRLFNPYEPDFYIAQSGLLSSQAAPNHTSTYQHEATQYTLGPGDSELRVPLSWADANGVTVTKTFVLRPGAYDIAVTHEVRNDSASAWTGNRYEQLQRSVPSDEGGACSSVE